MNTQKTKKIINNVKEKINELNSTTLCFGGPRVQKLPWGCNENDGRCKVVKKYLYKLIEDAIKNGYSTFISGIALGFDMICAEIVLDLKKKYPNIKLVCAVPCKDQAKIWNVIFQKKYEKILSRADKIRCIYDKYVDGCMLERNKYMINNSSYLIAYYDGTGGGTKYIINYAKKQKIKTKIFYLKKEYSKKDIFTDPFMKYDGTPVYFQDILESTISSFYN